MLRVAGNITEPGVVGDSATATLQQVQELMGMHRVWDRFPV